MMTVCVEIWFSSCVKNLINIIFAMLTINKSL